MIFFTASRFEYRGSSVISAARHLTVNHGRQGIVFFFWYFPYSVMVVSMVIWIESPSVPIYHQINGQMEEETEAPFLFLKEHGPEGYRDKRFRYGQREESRLPD